MKKEEVRFSFDNINWLKKKQKNNAIEKNSEQAQVALLKQLNIQLILTRKLTEKSLTYDKDKKQYVSRDNERVKKQSAFDIKKSVFLPQKNLGDDKEQKKQSFELPSLVKNVGIGIGVVAIVAMYAPMMWPFVKGMLKQMLPTFITEAAANISETAEKFIGLFKEGGAVYDAVESFKESTEQVIEFLSDLNPFTSKDEKDLKKHEKEIQKQIKKANKTKPDLSKSEWVKDDTKKISDKKNDDSKSRTNELEQNQNIIDKETEEFSKDTDDESGKQPESETQQQPESGTPQQQPEQQPESGTLEQTPPPTPVAQKAQPSTPQRSSDAVPGSHRTQPSGPQRSSDAVPGSHKALTTPTATASQQPPAITQPTPSGTQPSSESTSSTSSKEPPITPTNLNSVMDIQQGVIIDRFVPEFDRRLSMMAAAFQKETGKKLLATSGFRSNEKQKQLWDAKLRETGGNVNATRKWVAEPMPPPGGGTGSQHMKGLAIDINPLGAAGINVLAGTATGSTGWLEKFGLIRPIAHEDWHVQPSEIPPSADNPSAPGKPIVVPDASGNPTNVATGQKLNDISVANQQEKNKPTTHNVIIGVNTTKTAGLQKNA